MLKIQISECELTKWLDSRKSDYQYYISTCDKTLPYQPFFSYCECDFLFRKERKQSCYLKRKAKYFKFKKSLMIFFYEEKLQGFLCLRRKSEVFFIKERKGTIFLTSFEQRKFFPILCWRREGAIFFSLHNVVKLYQFSLGGNTIYQ